MIKTFLGIWPIIKTSALSHVWGSTPDDAGERLNGIQEVSGSIPLISTISRESVFYSPLKRGEFFF